MKSLEAIDSFATASSRFCFKNMQHSGNLSLLITLERNYMGKCWHWRGNNSQEGICYSLPMHVRADDEE